MINTHVCILSCETMDARGPADTAMMPSLLTVTVLIPSMTTPCCVRRGVCGRSYPEMAGATRGHARNTRRPQGFTHHDHDHDHDHEHDPAHRPHGVHNVHDYILYTTILYTTILYTSILYTSNTVSNTCKAHFFTQHDHDHAHRLTHITRPHVVHTVHDHILHTTILYWILL